jgi:hypothetical protein
MGRTVRAEHEVCLIGTRGRPRTRSRSIRSTFEAPVGRHPEKPAKFYSIIEALRDGPYVELFARRPRAAGPALVMNFPRTRTAWLMKGERLRAHKTQGATSSIAVRLPLPDGSMNSETQERLDLIVRAVLAVLGGAYCRACIIKEVGSQARDERLRVSASDVRARVIALWHEPTPRTQTAVT